MHPALYTPACELLGCRYPVVLAGMGGVARSELVAAVTEAGGFGFLGMVREPPELIHAEVATVRRAGHERFGVNLIPAATPPKLLELEVAACIELQVPAICLFWDISPALVRRLRDAGITVVYQVGSVEEGKAAAGAGAHMLIAQGVEAGGHVRGIVPVHELLAGLVDEVEVPVLAAGGMSGGGDLAMALALGAQGVVVGTAMIPTPESFAHDVHKERLLSATGGDTVLTQAFHINWPKGARVRVLASAVTRGERGDPETAERKIVGWEDGRPIYLFSTDSPLRSMTGDFDAMALYAGAGVGRVTKMTSAGQRLRRIVEEAEGLLHVPGGEGRIEASSPVCYADINAEYAGYLRHDLLIQRLERLRRLALAALMRSLEPAEKLAYARWVLALRALIGEVGGPASRGRSEAEPEADGAGPALLAEARELLPLVFEDRVREVIGALVRTTTVAPR